MNSVTPCRFAQITFNQSLNHYQPIKMIQNLQKTLDASPKERIIHPGIPIRESATYPGQEMENGIWDKSFGHFDLALEQCPFLPRPNYLPDRIPYCGCLAQQRHGHTTLEYPDSCHLFLYRLGRRQTSFAAGPFDIAGRRPYLPASDGFRAWDGGPPRAESRCHCVAFLELPVRCWSRSRILQSVQLVYDVG